MDLALLPAEALAADSALHRAADSEADLALQRRVAGSEDSALLPAADSVAERQRTASNAKFQPKFQSSALVVDFDFFCRKIDCNRSSSILQRCL